MKAAFSPQAAKQRLFCRLEVVYGADAFDDFGGGADLGDDFLQGLVGHGGFVDGVLHDAGGVNAGHLGPVFLHGQSGGGLLPAHGPAGPMGGGTLRAGLKELLGGISIHPPRGGAGLAPPISFRLAPLFQSTRPVGGGGTRASPPNLIKSTNFNPPAPWGDGTGQRHQDGQSADISIHPPRGERDHTRKRRRPWTGYFNPPAPWGAGLSTILSIPNEL